MLDVILELRSDIVEQRAAAYVDDAMLTRMSPLIISPDTMGDIDSDIEAWGYDTPEPGGDPMTIGDGVHLYAPTHHRHKQPEAVPFLQSEIRRLGLCLVECYANSAVGLTRWTFRDAEAQRLPVGTIQRP